jgi:hypothetical protein
MARGEANTQSNATPNKWRQFTPGAMPPGPAHRARKQTPHQLSEQQSKGDSNNYGG